MIRKMLIAISVLLNLGFAGLVGIYWLATSLGTSHLVAEIPGPEGQPAEYQIWFAFNGDLRMSRKQGGPTIELRDCYPGSPIVGATWKSKHHVIIHLADGRGLEFHTGFAYLDKADVKSLTTTAPAGENR